MIRLGLVGFGFWGPLLARNFHAHAGIQLATICDTDADRRADAQRLFPGARVAAHARELPLDPSLDAVAIATPAVSHFEIAREALTAGKHVFVEKPLTTRVEEAERLVEEAARRRLVLMVDHTFLFSPPVRHLAGLVETGALGGLLYYDSVRSALDRFAGDVNVLWDLAVHDLAVLDRLTGKVPLAISARGGLHGPDQRADIVFVTLIYGGNLLAHLHVNRVAPLKLRRTLVGGSLGAALWDDLEPVEKLRVFKAGVAGDQAPDEEHQRRVGYRVGDMWSPRLEVREPLAEAVAEFARAVEAGNHPLSDGESGLRVVRLLAAADTSLAGGGTPVDLCSGITA